MFRTISNRDGEQFTINLNNVQFVEVYDGHIRIHFKDDYINVFFDTEKELNAIMKHFKGRK